MALILQVARSALVLAMTNLHRNLPRTSYNDFMVKAPNKTSKVQPSPAKVGVALMPVVLEVPLIAPAAEMTTREPVAQAPLTTLMSPALTLTIIAEMP